MCLASLLRVQTACRSFFSWYHGTEGFPKACEVFGDSSFWTVLAKCESTIVPLAAASFLMEKDENTLADVVLCFGYIYRTLKNDELLSIIEQRWAKEEHPLLFLCFLVHPKFAYLARKLIRVTGGNNVFEY